MKQTFGATLALTVNALNNDMGKVPQMAWNTWNKFGCDISEKLVMQTVDTIVEMGLDQLGYDHVNLDDCWNLVDRTSDGH